MAATVFPLSIHPGRRYLIDSRGIPFLYNGDTGWFVLDKLSTDEYDHYLNHRRERSFNVIQVMAPWNDDVPNYYGEFPFEHNGDLSSPVEGWWARLDTFIGKALSRGMLVNIVPLWLGFNGDEWWVPLQANDLPVCSGFGRYLGSRYRKFPNVMWTIGGDHDPGDRYSRLNEIALGIKEVAPSSLLTAHTWENKSAADIFGDEDWLELNATYTYFPGWGSNRHVYALSRADYIRTPVRPFVLIESAYEDAVNGAIVTTPWQVRRQAYWSVLSGSTGFAFGNKSIWCFQSDWKSRLHDPGAIYMEHAYTFFCSVPWFRLVPDFEHKVVTEGYGTFNETELMGGEDYVTSAMTDDRTVAIAYLPATGTEQRSLTVNLTRFSGCQVTARWYNPVNGRYSLVGSWTVTDGEGCFLSPGDNGEGANDWLLLLETIHEDNEN